MIDTKGRVVLVVDDEDMIRRLVRSVLEADEFEVLEARGGEAALELATATHPAVVVLDILMPGLDGVEVCRRLDHEQIKVIVLTARDEPELARECREAGADAFLTKPFSSIELLDLVAKLVSH
ncbi:MAG TPA: response regulator [Acidimicrobiales bacterium]|nr:response regulator [Acidimicrobiales bacterium]